MKRFYLIIIVTLFTVLSVLNAQSDWEQLSGPYGGSIISISYDDNHYLAGTLNGGLYYSSDYGTNWKLVSSDLPFTRIDNLLFKNGRFFASNNTEGLYYSEDLGVTWTHTGSEMTTTLVSEIIDVDGKLFASTYDNGVFLSNDNGITWIQKSQGIKNIQVNNICSWGSAVYAATNNGIYVSGNYGESWGTLKETGTYRYIAVNGENIFISSYWSVYLTTDNGEHWDQADFGLGWGYVYSLVSSGPYIMAGRSGGYFASTYSSGEWVNVYSSLEGRRVYCLARDNNFLYAGTSKGIYYSQDLGGKWKETNTGINNQNISRVFIDNEKNIYAGTVYNGLNKSSDSGENWGDMSLGYSDIDNIFKNGDDLYVLTNTDMIMTETEGITWLKADYGIEDLSINDLFFKNDTLFVSTDLGVHYSANKGLRWYKFSSEVELWNVRSFYLDEDDVAYIATESGVYVSHNYGGTWNQYYDGMKSIDITYINGNGDYVYCGSRPEVDYDGEFYYTTNKGNEWISSDLKLRETYISKVLKIDDIFFIIINGTSEDEEIGVFYSTNYGKTWKNYNNNILNNSVNDIFYDGTEIYAATNGSGIYKNEIPEVLLPPNLTYPENMAEGIMRNTTLDFDDVEGVESYQIELAERDSFEERFILIEESSTISEYQLPLDTLQYNSDYYWRVNYIKDGSQSDWSEIYSFKTESEQKLVTDLISPADMEINENVNLQFNWEELENTNEYTLEISEDSEMNEVLFSIAVNNPYYTINPGILNFNSMYYWRVKAKVNDAYREWSLIYSFSTKEFDLITPTNLLPFDDSEEVVFPITFSWDDDDIINEWHIRISDLDDFSVNIVDSTLNQSSVMFDKDVLEYTTQYFWQVRGKYFENYTDWTEVYSLVSETEVSVDDLELSSINLYPNPVKNIINISGIEADASIRITDILGRVILEKSFIADSETSIQIPQDIQSGKYFLIIEYSNKVQTKSLTIIR